MSSYSSPTPDPGGVAEPRSEAGRRSGPEPGGAAEPGREPGGRSDPYGSADEAVLAEEAEVRFADAEGVPATDVSGEEAPAAADAAGFPPEATDEAMVALPPPDPFEALARERDEYRDALVRLQADFENYKKRVFKQQDEQRDRATEALVDKLLPVLDTADLALSHGGGEDVKQLGAALVAALEKEGLERIDPQGGPFDPTLHDGVAHEPGEGGVQEVAEVMRAGYRWKGRVIRPAMVRVRG